MTQAVPPDLAPQDAPPERVAFKRGEDVYLVNADEAALMRPEAGWVPATDADVARAERRADFANNPALALSAAALGFGRSASLGGTDVALTQGAGLVGDEQWQADTAATLEDIKKTHPFASLVGEGLGLLAGGAAAKALKAAGGSMLARGGARALQAVAAPSVGAAAVGELASSAASKAVNAALGEGATGLAARLAQRAVPGAIGAGLEAGIYGAGQAVSEAAIKNEPLTAEALAASAGHAALLGAGIGGGLGALSGIGRASADRVAGLLRRETTSAERSAVAAEATTAAEREAVRDATETTTRKVVEEPVGGVATGPTPQQATGDVLRSAAEIAGDATGEVVEAGRSALKSAVEGLRQNAADAPALLNKMADDQVIRSVTGNYVKSSRVIEKAERMTPGFRKEFAEWAEREIPQAAGRKNLAAVFDDELKLAAVSDLVEKAGTREGSLLEALDAASTGVVPSASRIVESAEKIAARFDRTPGASGLAKELRQFVNDEYGKFVPKGANDSILPPSFREMHSGRVFLDKEKAKWASMNDSARSEMYRELRGVIEEEIIRAGDEAASKMGGAFRKDYLAAKKEYRFAKTAEEALENKVAHGHKNNVSSITDPLWSGVGGGIGGIPGALAGVALNQVRRRAGNELAAVTLRQMAKIDGIQGVADRLVTKLDTGIDLAIRSGERAAAAPRQASQAARAVRRTVEETTTRVTRDREYERTVSSVRAAASNERATAERIEQSLAPVAQAAPQVARQTVSTVLRGVAFLDSKIPVGAMRADTMTPHLDQPRASQDEKARFMRYARAVNDPVTVIEDLRAGKITREGVEAVREVYPQLYAQIQQAAVSRLANLDKPISYAQRVQLSILLGVAGDPSLQPKALADLQATYGTNTGGGGASSPSAGGPAMGAQAQGPQLRRALNLAQAMQTSTQATEAE